MDVHNIVFEKVTQMALWGGVLDDRIEHDLVELCMDETCSYCDRKIAEQPIAFGKLGFSGVDAYGAQLTLCGCCRTYNINNPSVMGIENPKRPNVGQKWGMLAGSGAFISIDTEETVLFMPKKSSTKFPEAVLEEAKAKLNIDVVNVSGLVKQLEVINSLQNVGRCIWIRYFGRKTDVLIQNLVISPSLSSLIEVDDKEYNSSTSCLRKIDLISAREIARLLADNNKSKAAFLKSLTMYIKGLLSPAKMMELLNQDEYKPMQSVMRLLPADPHARLRLMAIATKLKG